MKKNNKQKIENLKEALKRKLGKKEYENAKIYILNDENVIVITGKYSFFKTMEHFCMIYSELTKMASYPATNNHGRVLKKHKLFMLMNNFNHSYENICTAVYDYQNFRIIIPKGKFDNIGYDAAMSIIEKYTPDINYLEKYNCFLGTFTLSCGQSEVVTYISPLNNREYHYSFEPKKETYYAFINTDGSIRNNTLFKGENLTRIEEVIDLRQYGSLEEFKKQRMMALIEMKEKNKKEYLNKLNQSYEDHLPYRDSEVIKVLRLEK